MNVFEKEVRPVAAEVRRRSEICFPKSLIKKFIALVLFLTMPSMNAQTAFWEALPALPEQNGNSICGAIGNDIILLGGITWKNETKHWLNTMWHYQSKEKTWREIGKLPQPLAYAAFDQTKDGVYFVGGSDGKKMNGDFYLLNAKLELKKLAEISEPLVYSGSAISSSKLFIVAGASDPADLKTITNTFYSVDLVSRKTEVLTPFPGGKWMIPTAAAIGDQLFVFTGAYQDGTNNSVVNTDSAFVYSRRDAIWRKIKSYPFPVRGLASCALDERYILLGGGYTQDFIDVAFIYDTKNNTYAKTKPLPYRAMANFIKAGDYLYWLGGEDRMKHRSELFYRIAWKELLNAKTAH
jgi:N-acetylneuraminic acid mutarotase